MYAQKTRKVETVAAFELKNSLGLSITITETRTGADKHESQAIAGGHSKLLSASEALRLAANDKDSLACLNGTWFHLEGEGMDKSGRFAIVPETGELRPLASGDSSRSLVVIVKPGKRGRSISISKTDDEFQVELSGDTWAGAYAPVVVAKRTETCGTMELFANEATREITARMGSERVYAVLRNGEVMPLPPGTQIKKASELE